MISGIRSLCATHEQVILAWTGDIEHSGPSSGGGASGPTSGKGSKATLSSGTRGPVPSSSLTDEDKAILEAEIANYQSPHDKEIGGKGMSYVPVFLDDKIAHGHYEGYCKTSAFIPLINFLEMKKLIASSSLATLPLSPLARRRYGGSFRIRTLERLSESERGFCQETFSNLSYRRFDLGARLSLVTHPQDLQGSFEEDGSSLCRIVLAHSIPQ